MKSDERKESRILILLGIVPVVWFALLTAPFFFDGLLRVMEKLPEAMQHPFRIQMCKDSLKTVLLFLACYGMGIGIYLSTRRNYRRGEEHGSAQWGNAQEINKKYSDKKFEANKLMTKHVRISYNSRKHRRNLLTIAVGGSGSGKTRFFCKPNLMQANTSFVVLDPKGENLRDTGHLLEAEGYEVRVLDLINMEKSHCYNPFVYLKDDNDVQRLVTNLFKATTPKGSQSNDPFWDTAASMLLLALIFYLKYEAPKEEQNFPMVMEMLRAGEVREDNDDYSVTTIKKGYGFRVRLTFADDTSTTQQHSGYKTKREANAVRDEIIGQLHDRTYIVYGKIKVADFLEFWLEDVKRLELTDDSYGSYKNVVYNYAIPQIGKMYMQTLNQGYIRKFYNVVAEQSESVARLTKTVMQTALEYAKSKNVVSENAAKDVMLPKKIKKKAYRTLNIDVKKTLTLPQVFQLIEASKETPIHMQILFAVLMGLRRGEINGLKYSDVDYINQTLKVQRQLGKKPNSKAEDFEPKMLTKQEIKTKTPSSVRELPIPDYVFEAILEQRKIYEKNRRRRKREFRDWNYICCSTYGNPRSKSYHHKYYKELLVSLGLPDIHFHQLRNTYTTILLKNDFNIKGIASMLGHSKEIITADVYGDTTEIIEDCLDVIEPFMEEVMPKRRKDKYYDYSDMEEIDGIVDEYLLAA